MVPLLIFCAPACPNYTLLKKTGSNHCHISKGLDLSLVNLGVFRMFSRVSLFAAAALSLALLAPTGSASAADLPVKAKVKAVADLPFFLLIDDRVTFSWMPKGTDPGEFSNKPGGGLNSTTAKQVYFFPHFDT